MEEKTNWGIHMALEDGSSSTNVHTCPAPSLWELIKPKFLFVVFRSTLVVNAETQSQVAAISCKARESFIAVTKTGSIRLGHGTKS